MSLDDPAGISSPRYLLSEPREQARFYRFCRVSSNTFTLVIDS